MKKEFSLYEFAGIMVPSTILLFGTVKIVEFTSHKELIDFSKIGESVVFIAIAYGLGHLLHGLGNLIERVMWFVLGGWPTNWIARKPWHKRQLLNDEEAIKVLEKLTKQYGDLKSRDWGMTVYNYLFQKNKTVRIDIFNANYSLFRGMLVAFIVLSVMVWPLCTGYEWLLLALSVLSLMRMYHFSVHYAKEIYRTYLNVEA